MTENTTHQTEITNAGELPVRTICINAVVPKTPEESQAIQDTCFDAMEAMLKLLNLVFPGKTYDDVMYGPEADNPDFEPFNIVIPYLRCEAEACAEADDRRAAAHRKNNYAR